MARRPVDHHKRAAEFLQNPGFETEISASWAVGGSAGPSLNQSHEGAASMLLGQSGSVNQTLGGGIPNTFYAVTGYYLIQSSNTTVTLNVGGAYTTGTTPSSWQPISVYGGTDANGNLFISLSASANNGTTPVVYVDDLSISIVNPAIAWGQTFG